MRKYPTQDDCQLLVDLMNRPHVYTGTVSDPEFKKLGEDANNYPKSWVKMFDKAFGEKSPWNVRVTFLKNGMSKRVLYWDKEKAEKLGI